MITQPCDQNAIPEVKRVLEYFHETEGNFLLTGQHTQTMETEELSYIREVTGKLPAVCGFELLSYSPNINWQDADEECLQEVAAASGTLKKAWEWAEKKGLITFTWHWFSPLSGHGKSFFGYNTDFNAEKALEEGTVEHAAMCHDLDIMAELLRGFADRHIPILWRPFHEAEGIWFWWGAHGPQTAAKLYRFMFRYFTEKHDLHNLIWVWNCPLPEGYVGDECCDIISRDLYPEAHMHGDYADRLEELQKITPTQKGCALAETGVIPDIDAVAAHRTAWLWYMTWSREYCRSEQFTTKEVLKKMYNHPAAVTLDTLPALY